MAKPVTGTQFAWPITRLSPCAGFRSHLWKSSTIQELRKHPVVKWSLSIGSC